MSASRLKSLGKLVFLIGLPVAFVGGLFGAGVYVGSGHRAGILAFERDWLGRDVEVPGEPPKPVAEVKPEPTPTPTPEVKAEPTPEVTPEVKPPPEVVPAPDVRPTPEAALPAEALPIAVADPDPLPAELQPRLDERLKVRVKVVVDADVFDRRGDWIDYTERHVRWASQVLARQLGVELELRGVVAWPVTWPNGQAALVALQDVGRDGADLVVGLGGRSLRVAVQAGPTSAAAHAGTAVAFADATAGAPHLRGFIRAVTHAMGGDPIVGDAVPLAFAAEDRRIILDRKHLPFASEAEEEAAPPAPPVDDPAPEGDN